MRGIEIHNPISFGFIQLVQHEYKTTWAEKQRGKIVHRLQRRKAIRNWFLLVPILIVTIGSVIVGMCLLGIFMHNPISSLACGYTGSQLIILLWVIITDAIPVNPYDISIKHKGKKL